METKSNMIGDAMNILELCNLQGTLFLLMLIGALLKKRGIIDAAGKRCLTDLCVTVIIPCSIIKSCMIEFNSSILKACALVLLVGVLIQAIALGLNLFLYNGYEKQQKNVLQYCTIVSNGGFLGNPVAEGVYGDIGLLYASMFLIPMRVVMWSAGTSYFIAGSTSKKQVLRNVATHPCLVAVYIGLFLMVTQLRLPGMLESTIRYIAGSNSAITMFIVGTILADVKLLTIFNKDALLFSVLRLVALPAAAYGLCLLFGLARDATGVSVMMTGMPAGATAAIFAERYHSDAPFATKCVVLTTLLSMATIPIWCYLVG